MKKYILILFIIIIAASSCKKNNPATPPPNNVLPGGGDTTQVSNKVSDIDGNVYTSIKIGTQVWLQQGLRATHYRDGSAIPNITNDSAWGSLTTGAYCNYNNDTANANVYGRLYNWYAISSSSNICPAGWHIPSDSEWNVLVTYLGGDSVAGTALKSPTLWNSSNVSSGTNNSEFSGLPTGYRSYNGTFNAVGILGLFWTSSTYSDKIAWYQTLDYRNSELVPDVIVKQAGFSCRCIKD